jgi:rhodanese-related sulfurtransferase
MNKTSEVVKTVEENKTPEAIKAPVANKVCDHKTHDAKQACGAGEASAVKVITMSELDAKMKAGEPLQLINVLDAAHYNLGMIKGSLKIPAAELETRSGELDKSKEVVTYCADVTCSASRKAAELLAAKGFKVSAYEGGIKEWVAAKLPVEAATTPV